MSNSQKNFMSIRSKLLAAVAMLLVASFMVVSSTYAWFTLSTAPEVTGITTQVGANGNLEIALNTGETITSSVGDGTKGWADKNKTWGNLVSLSGNGANYGLDRITLNPSVIVLTNASTADDAKIALATPLATPVYTADGRVESLLANGVFGIWNPTDEGFSQSTKDATNIRNQYGVSALGTVSNMTRQQLEYALALTAVRSNLDAANKLATTAVRDNGGGLVNLILKGATATESETFDTDDVAPLLNMITVLNGDGASGGAVGQLNAAIKNHFITLAAYALSAETDDIFVTVKGEIETNWATYMDQLRTSQGTITIAEKTVTIQSDLLTNLQAMIQVHDDVAEALTDAQDAYDTGVTDDFTWTEVTNVMAPLMNISSVKVNDKTYSDIKDMYAKKDGERKEDFGNFVGSCTGGVTVSLPDGSGVFADIAKLSGSNINASFRATVDVPGMVSIPNMLVNMETTLETSDFVQFVNAGEPAGRANDTSALISTTYAYVLDLAFRTNADNSDLLLQTDATGRIYSDGVEATQGGGSFMQFHTNSQTFATSDIIGLMENVRIVFANTADGEVLATAMLNTTATGLTYGKTADQLEYVQAEIVLCQGVTTKQITSGGATITTFDFSAATAKTGEDADVLKALGKNTPENISVFVYLDGETIQNGDVAADAVKSVVGKMNLQFSSSANLEPMQYSGTFEEID